MDPTLYLALWPCWNLSSYTSRRNELWGIRAGRGLEIPSNSTIGKTTKISSGKIRPLPKTRKRYCSYCQGRLSKILGNQGPQLLKLSNTIFSVPFLPKYNTTGMLHPSVYDYVSSFPLSPHQHHCASPYFY